MLLDGAQSFVAWPGKQQTAFLQLSFPLLATLTHAAMLRCGLSAAYLQQDESYKF